MSINPIVARVTRLFSAPTTTLVLAGTLSFAANAQDPLNDEHPELARLLNANGLEGRRTCWIDF